MINTDLLCDSIDILEEGIVATDTGFINDCAVIHENIPALLWCGEGNLEIFSCLPKKRTTRDLCVEIAPDIQLACFDKQFIIKVTRNGCDIGTYRVFDVIPQRLIATKSLYSYHLIATQIDG